jgi:hypothetical protein
MHLRRRECDQAAEQGFRARLEERAAENMTPSLL